MDPASIAAIISALAAAVGTGSAVGQAGRGQTMIGQTPQAGMLPPELQQLTQSLMPPQPIQNSAQFRGMGGGQMSPQLQAALQLLGRGKQGMGGK